MPLDKALEFFSGHRAAFETVFWIIVLAIAYVVMTKVMHPAGKILGY